MEYQKQFNEFTLAAFLIAILALIGSLLSLLNVIPLMIGYQLLHEARNRGILKKHDKIIATLLEAGMLLTLCISILYITLHIS